VAPVLERWTRSVIRLRFVVLVCWLAVVVVGILSATRLPPLLSTSLAVPGTSSQLADTILARHFGENPDGTFTVLFRTGKSSTGVVLALTQRVARAVRVLDKRYGRTAHATPLHAVAGIVYGQVVTGLDIQDAERYTDGLRFALAHRGGSGATHLTAYVTGAPAIQHDLNPVLAADLRKGEMIALPVALLILALVLGLRAVIVVPLVFAGGTITATLAIVYAMAHVILMVSYVPNLVELIGLGLAIDYSLLVVNRFIEEVAVPDRTVDEAIVRTMATAGRAVMFSGVAVAIGLSVILIIDVPYIRSLGIAGAVVPVVSIVAALTLQPALLSLLGRGGVRSIAFGPALGRPSDFERGLWARLAVVVMRRRVTVAAVAILVLAGLAAPVLRLQLTPGSISAIPQSMKSAHGLTLLTDHVGPGAITPIDVVIDSGAPGRANAPAIAAAELRLGTRLLKDPAAYVVAIGSKAPYVDPSRRYGRVIVDERNAFGDEATQRLVTRLRQEYIPAAHFPAGVHISTGGAPAQGVDFLARVYGTLPWVILAILVVTYLVLLRAFKSLLLPVMALALDALTVAATYGMLVIIFRFGIGADAGHTLGITIFHIPQIEGWIPVFLFAMLFGLSMDYEVFLVTRMREAWDDEPDNVRAVTIGIEKTGRIVTAAAAIMVVSFAGFMAGRVAGLQEFGAGLALGVLLDATVVRILLLPSLMAMLGQWCWWLPAPIARFIGVAASPLAQSERRGRSNSP
jgi:uncharacterized membrane protein YdfJ with MMPL/SSD domain